MSDSVDLRGLQTEGRNPNSANIDRVSTAELCQIINDEDATVAEAVKACLPAIADAIDSLALRVRRGGRVLYVGAGTSGRLGVLDASEIPPTYSAPAGQFVALIAGGDRALRHAQEGAEDDVQAAVTDLKALSLNGQLDSLIGIAASGRTPYVLSCLSYAKSLGCKTIGIACSFPSAMSKCGNVDHMINVVTGPEIVTGSTRMKAGTATKLVLNMLSTGTMIKTGKTFGNMMIDLRATNLKLQQRSRNILKELCGALCPESDSQLNELLKQCGGSVKLAAAALILRCSVEEARQRLKPANGVLSSIVPSDGIGSSGLSLQNGFNPEDYVLCIDGGGSKCAAAIRSKKGDFWLGEAGPCNASDIGVEKALHSISSAVQIAVNSCPPLKGRKFQSIAFSQIWIGLAGNDRKSVSIPLIAELEKAFHRKEGPSMRVTDDIELLASAAGTRSRLSSAIVLIAGTGSVAMSYRQEGEAFVRTGRCGGWGPLLGDDGSGYDIGRQGVRLALGSLDEVNLRRDHSRSAPLDFLTQQILQHFGIDTNQESAYDLLTAVVAPRSDIAKLDLDVKRRIATVARLVIDASARDDRAKAIVESAAQSLVRTAHPLLVNQSHEPGSSVLVLAGGLMQSKTFQMLVKDMISSYGMKFGDIEVVNQPALLGAEYLDELRRRTPW